MAPPIYFLPGISREQIAPKHGALDRSILHARGLADVLADIDSPKQLALSDITGKGPGDKSGCLLVALPTDPHRDFVCTFKVTNQDWEPIGDGAQYWIGIDRTHGRPSPADLARRRLHPGYVVQLADGKPWMVPTIRRPDGGTSLPCAYQRDAAGNLTTPIKPEYVEIWEQAGTVLELFLGGDPEYDTAWGVDFAVRALALNYRFDWNLQNRLGLIDSTNLSHLPDEHGSQCGILEAVTDVPMILATINAHKKKLEAEAAEVEPTVPATANTSPGPEA